MRFFLIIVCCCFGQYAICQVRLSGKVMDSITKQPIQGVSIFLSNTSIGTVSDAKGEYTIEHIPQGKFEVIASSLNYEAYVSTIRSFQKPVVLLIKMKSSSNILKEVVVESYDKDGWAKWGTYFNANFIGTSNLTKNCLLRNPEAVKFRLNKKTNTVRAFAEEKLIFENKALGYNIKYLLTKFEFNITTNTFKYVGYPLFENRVPETADQQKKWDAARLNTYSGSLLHFMRSLFNNTLVEEGFQLRIMKKVSDAEKSRVRKLFKRKEVSTESNSHNREKRVFMEDADSLEYYKKVISLSGDEDQVLFNKTVSRDSILFPIDASIDPNAILFAFDDYLHITYLHKKEPYEYTKFLLKRPDKDYISSDITLPFQKGISVYKNGTYFYGENLFTNGFWAWSEKLSTMLPTDYFPDIKL